MNNLSFKVGEFTITPVPAGVFIVSEKKVLEDMPDSMRGTVVPKPAQVTVTVFLIEHPDAKILIDTGTGASASGDLDGNFSLLTSYTVAEMLPDAGAKPEDITHVIITHRHFDHICGCTTFSDGKLVPSFANARYVIQKGEWDICAGGSRKRSYFSEHLAPLHEFGRLEIIEGDAQILPGVFCERTGGHSEHHQIVRIESGGERLLHAGDLISRTAYAGYGATAGYNYDHELALRLRKELVARAARENAALAFGHDERVSLGRPIIAHGCVEVRPVRLVPPQPDKIKTNRKPQTH
jgi:glyoxylase-like metal-dependent hydrolase (beta-lactamase superfamily II)